MSQNPYSSSGMNMGTPSGGFDTPLGEPRTSMMAVASLVLGIVSIITCCVGAVTGVPAAAFGIAAIISINSKQGMLVGRGMAVGGIVTGTIGLFFTIIFWAMGASFVSNAATLAGQPMNGIENLDVRPLKEVLTAEAGARLDEPTMLAFRKAYQDRLGSFQHIDTNVLNYGRLQVKTYSDPQVQTRMKTVKVVPVVVWGVFDKGKAQLWYIVPQGADSSGNQNARSSGNKSAPDIFINLIIVPEEGLPIQLFPDLPTAPTNVPSTAPAGTGAALPTNPDAGVPPAGDAPPTPPKADPVPVPAPGGG